MKKAYLSLILVMVINTIMAQNQQPASITICNKVWMTQNLDVATYRNGDIIPQVKDFMAWSSLTTGAWCWYKNDSTKYAVYGRLYNWFAVNDKRGLAPQGWHVANDNDWDNLATCMSNVIDFPGNPLRETGTAHWKAPNSTATNKSGFTALPGGGCDEGGMFDGIGTRAIWWSATQRTKEIGTYKFIDNTTYRLSDDTEIKTGGFSVRCVKD